MDESFLVAKVAVSSAVYSIDKPYDYLVPRELREQAQVGQRVVVPFGNGNKKTDGFLLELVVEQEKRRLKEVSHIFLDETVLTKENIALALWMRKRYFCTFFEAANAQLPPGMWNKMAELFFPAGLSQEQARHKAGSAAKQQLVDAVYAASGPLSASALAKLTCSKEVEKQLRQLVRQGILASKQEFQKKIGDKQIVMAHLGVPIEQARQQMGNGKMAKKRMDVLEHLAQAGSLPEKELCYLTGVSSSLIKRLETQGLIQLEKVETYRRPHIKKSDAAPVTVLSASQQAVYDRLIQLMDGQPHAALLHGVTGSGKTAVYVELIRMARSQGRSAILLVPEIALTPQMVRQFCLYFRDDVAVVHSALTYAQRYDEFKRIKAGKAHVVIGTRSAIFAPLENIGVFILDEEQEYSYKSESPPRYHARDVAKYRASRHGALVVLGSATPSIESAYFARTGKYINLSLGTRYNNMPLPRTIISDMRGALQDGAPSVIGRELEQELRVNLERGEQSILFINRRGNSRMVACVECGHIPSCENCSVALVYHSKNGRLMCHHCGYSTELPSLCPDCGGEHLKLIGAGTQKIESELERLFPGIKIVRMDADTTSGRTSHEKLLDQFAADKADILLGTQMVSKGLDFEGVTLVGVLDADLSLYCGDYHAQERTFSLLTQVVGRAGRRQMPGRAIIQTYTPKNPIILAAAAQDYEAFYQYEIASREALEAPPFQDLFVFMLSGVNDNEVLRAALRVAATIGKAFSGAFADLRTDVLGPVSAPIARVNKRFRYTVSFRGQDSGRVRLLVAQVLHAFYQSPQSKTTTIAADMNPYSV